MISGQLVVDGKALDFTGGRGYREYWRLSEGVDLE
jgi:hypothetical protein